MLCDYAMLKIYNILCHISHIHMFLVSIIIFHVNPTCLAPSDDGASDLDFAIGKAPFVAMSGGVTAVWKDFNTFPSGGPIPSGPGPSTFPSVGLFISWKPLEMEKNCCRFLRFFEWSCACNNGTLPSAPAEDSKTKSQVHLRWCPHTSSIGYDVFYTKWVHAKVYVLSHKGTHFTTSTKRRSLTTSESCRSPWFISCNWFRNSCGIESSATTSPNSEVEP